MKNNVNKPVPLAYGYVEDGRLYTELHWEQMEKAFFCNTIGKELMNFAFIDDESLYDVIFESTRAT